MSIKKSILHFFAKLTNFLFSVLFEVANTTFMFLLFFNLEITHFSKFHNHLFWLTFYLEISENLTSLESSKEFYYFFFILDLPI